MFEYIKRVSVAINFIAQKIDNEGVKIRDVLETLSLELLGIAQSFRNDKFKTEDLKNLQDKIIYLIDLVDFARINGFVTHMNAKIFIDTQIVFLKHISNLLEQKNSLFSPLNRLKELEELFARKSGKENAQSKFVNALDFGFSEALLQTREKAVSEDPASVNSLLGKSFETETILEIKEEKKIIENPVLVKENKKNNVENVEKDIKARRTKILDILSGGGCSIKEISVKMPDINEKTLQRDLLELMQDKKVIMLGKKRWARYYLR